MGKILVLGAGLVSRPLVHYLTAVQGIEVTVASRTVAKAQQLVAGRQSGRAVALDVQDHAALEQLVADHDLAISLLPASQHVRVAQICLKQKKHMATTSYISPEMKALDSEARAAGLTFLNECGVDPGIDHMSAMRIIHQAEQNQGQVISFRSFCGGLPAPEANDNPLGYKFSWTPLGVLKAATSQARYLSDGKEVSVDGRQLFGSPEIIEVPGAGRFEAYPNRDSLIYLPLYGLDSSVTTTMFRGTLRNLGHCETWYQWVQLGLLDFAPRPLDGKTFQQFMVELAGGEEPLPCLAARAGIPVDHPALTKLDWLGLLAEDPLPIRSGGSAHVMAVRMAERCAYAPGERDMIVLKHEFQVAYPGRQETVHSILVDFGIPGKDSSMSRTVSLPVAIAARMIIQGQLSERGVIAPLTPALYNPILDELNQQGITLKEWSE